MLLVSIMAYANRRKFRCTYIFFYLLQFSINSPFLMLNSDLATPLVRASETVEFYDEDAVLTMRSQVGLVNICPHSSRLHPLDCLSYPSWLPFLDCIRIYHSSYG